jgi:hypothetical protein
VLWKATGEKPIILQITVRKWRWIGHTLMKGEESIKKTSIGLESAASQERKTEANLENDGFGGSRKCDKT